MGSVGVGVGVSVPTKMVDFCGGKFCKPIFLFGEFLEPKREFLEPNKLGGRWIFQI